VSSLQVESGPLQGLYSLRNGLPADNTGAVRRCGKDGPVPLMSVRGHGRDEVEAMAVLFPSIPQQSPFTVKSLVSLVPWRAVSIPTMAVTMPLSWMKRICRSKMDGGSLSKPTMNPAWTCRPACWIRRTQSRRSRFLFCTLRFRRVPFVGVSMR